MNANDNNDRKNRDCESIELDPPAFSPPPEMRAHYLGKRRAELDDMIDHARNGEWKPVMNIAGNVRGSGAMFGFENIGTAAENLVKAVQNGDAKSFEFMEKYAEAVNASYV